MSPLITVGPMTHGGTCITHLDGKVGFVRGAIPGETVRIRITKELSRRFYADTVEVISPSPARCESIWPEAVDKGLGGAELSHISPPFQRKLKEGVLRDCFSRVGGAEFAEHMHDMSLTMHGYDDVGWRLRADVMMTEHGIGMYRETSHDIIAFDSLPFVVKEITAADIFGSDSALVAIAQPGERVRLVADDNRVVASVHPRGAYGSKPHKGQKTKNNLSRTYEWDGKEFRPCRDRLMFYRVGSDTYQVDVDGFWQGHRQAAEALRRGVLSLVDHDRSDTESPSSIIELYSGAGLFSVPLARRATLSCFEGASRAVVDAKENLRRANVRATVRQARIDARFMRNLAQHGSSHDVILDPSRSGAGKETIKELIGLGAKKVIYVACDIAAGVRDVAELYRGGYRITQAECHDLFPHTHHLEVIYHAEKAN